MQGASWRLNLIPETVIGCCCRETVGDLSKTRQQPCFLSHTKEADQLEFAKQDLLKKRESGSRPSGRRGFQGKKDPRTRWSWGLSCTSQGGSSHESPKGRKKKDLFAMGNDFYHFAPEQKVRPVASFPHPEDELRHHCFDCDQHGAVSLLRGGDRDVDSVPLFHLLLEE